MAMDFDAVWDFSDPIESEERFRALAETVAGDERLEVLTQVARALGLQGQFWGAEKILEEVSVANPGATAKVRYLLEMGRVKNSGGSPEEALPFFIDAWKLAREVDEDGLAVDAAHMVAIAIPDPSDKFEWNERALELANSSPDPKAQKWRASLLNNLGWTYHEEGDFEQALAAFIQAQKLRLSAGETVRERHARWAVARCLRSLGRVQESLDMQLQLKIDDPTDTYVDEEIAACRDLLAKS